MFLANNILVSTEIACIQRIYSGMEFFFKENKKILSYDLLFLKKYICYEVHKYVCSGPNKHTVLNKRTAWNFSKI